MVWTPQLAGAFPDLAQTAEPDLYPMWHLITHRGLYLSDPTARYPE